MSFRSKVQVRLRFQAFKCKWTGNTGKMVLPHAFAGLGPLKSTWFRTVVRGQMVWACHAVALCSFHTFECILVDVEVLHGSQRHYFHLEFTACRRVQCLTKVHKSVARVLAVFLLGQHWARLEHCRLTKHKHKQPEVSPTQSRRKSVEFSFCSMELC